MRAPGASSQALGPTLRSNGFAEHGIAAEFHFLSGAQLTEATRDTLAKHGEIDAVVVGGGDGSVRTMAATRSSAKCAYRSAIFAELSPSNFATTLKLAPAFMTRAEAKVWRSPWKFIGGSILARAHASSMGRRWFESRHGLPSSLRNINAPSARPATLLREKRGAFTGQGNVARLLQYSNRCVVGVEIAALHAR